MLGIICVTFSAQEASQILQGSGLTRKTVKKRLDRLVENKAFYIRAVFDASR